MSDASLPPRYCDDLRPTLTEYETVVLAVGINRDAILKWAALNECSLGQEPEIILETVTHCIVQANADPARAARLMELTYQWKVSDRIIWHFEVVKKNLPLVLGQRIARWVIETGIRFPADAGDMIAFVGTSDSTQRHAKVVKVFNATASALVRGENGSEGIVFSEQVIVNHTNTGALLRSQPLHNQRLPTFGQRITPPASTS